MADISDVETVMVRMISGFLGLGQNYREGSAVLSSTAGAVCRVYRGWPIAASLDQDLAGKIMSVSVFPIAGATRRTTRFMPQWHASTVTQPRIVATVAGTTVSLGGYPDLGQVVGLRLGAGQNGPAYAYRLKPGDTIASAASSLAAMIPGATAIGSSITLPTGTIAVARVAVDQVEWLETRRQMQSIWVMGWAYTPVIRDTVMRLIDEGFANMTDAAGNLTYFIPLPDGSFGDLRYYSNSTFDKSQQANVWRRDLRYSVDYPTTLIETHPELMFAGADVEIDGDAIVWVGDAPQAPS